MKICFISKGESCHSPRWAKALSEAGIDLYFISACKVDLPDVKQINVPIYSRNPIVQLSNNRKLIKIIKNIDPDVVHLFGLFPLANIGCMFLAKHLHPLVISVLGSDIISALGKESIKQRIIKKYLLANSDLILSTSSYLAAQTEQYVDNSKDIGILYWGVDLTLFHPNQKRKSQDRIVIGFAKTLHSLSGADILLEAFAKAINVSGKKLFLKIAGDGVMKQDLSSMSKKLGLEDSVEWCGWLEGENLRAFYRSLDIFVMPSRRESFGMAAVEAIASGIPVIASRLGGIPEIVTDGVNGLLINPEDVDSFADSIIRLVDDSKLRRNMGRLGRQLAEKNFDWQMTMTQVIKKYSEMCGK